MATARRILVATDFSAGAACAAGVAIELAVRWGARLDWIHVFGEPPHALTPSGDALLAQWADHHHREARSALDTLQKRAADRGLESTTHLLPGRPGAVVSQCAEETGADLVVVGTHGHSGLHSILLGSVAEKVVRQSSVPVLCVRPGSRAGAPVVWGEDFGDAGPRRAAVELAGSLGSPLVAVHSVELPPAVAADTSFAPPPALLDACIAEARDRMGELAPEYGEGAETVVGVGPAAGALCDEALRRNAGLVVTGTAARKGLERWMLGSVAEKTLRSAPCSVLILK